MNWLQPRWHCLHMFPIVQVFTALRTAALGLSTLRRSDAPALSAASNKLKVCRKEKKNQQKKTLPALSASQQWEMEGAAAWSWVSACRKGSCIYLVNELLGAIKLFEAGAQWADCPPWCSWGAGGPSGGWRVQVKRFKWWVPNLLTPNLRVLTCWMVAASVLLSECFRKCNLLF